METAYETRAVAQAVGRNLKRKNAVTAILCGAVPGLIASKFLELSASSWLVGIAFGLLWANAFEYFYHRYLLHWPKSSFGQGHLLHHLTTGTPREPAHVTFGRSPLWLAMLFATNGVPLSILDWRLGLGFAPGILTGFSLYMVLVEEIHWQVHLGGWLPGLRVIREYHLAHHDIPEGRYNVFFPVFDLLFGSIEPTCDSTNASRMALAVRSFDTGNYVFAAVTQAAMWIWLACLTIGARYFWTTRSKT